MEKICTSCKDNKDIAEFNKNKGRKDGYSNTCRLCSNERSKLYYEENKEKHKKITTARNKKKVIENKQRLYDFYKNNPCIDCGNDNPIVLELDHKDGADKVGCLSVMVNSGYCWKTLEKEINKCDVRCANCHRIRTSLQQGWYKNLKK
jgi:hypothetical protein